MASVGRLLFSFRTVLVQEELNTIARHCLDLYLSKPVATIESDPAGAAVHAADKEWQIQTLDPLNLSGTRK
jgi:hypothetical protein